MLLRLVAAGIPRERGVGRARAFNDGRPVPATILREGARGGSLLPRRSGRPVLEDQRHRGGPPDDLHGANEPAFGVSPLDPFPASGGLHRPGYAPGLGEAGSLTLHAWAVVVSWRRSLVISSRNKILPLVPRGLCSFLSVHYPRPAWEAGPLSLLERRDLGEI